MPRFREFVSHIDSGNGEHREEWEGLLDVPPRDRDRKIRIHLMPNHHIELVKSDDGEWSLTTSLKAVYEHPKYKPAKETSK